MTGDELAQMVLGEQVDGKVVLENRDVRVFPYRGDERPFDLGSGEILVVEDSVLGVSSFAVQFEAAVRGLVEAGPPGDQIPDHLRGAAYDQFNRGRIAFAGSADQGVVDVFFECVGSVRNRTDAALGVVRIALLYFAFRYDCNMSVLGRFQRETQTGSTGSDDQKIGSHGFSGFCQKTGRSQG